MNEVWHARNGIVRAQARAWSNPVPAARICLPARGSGWRPLPDPRSRRDRIYPLACLVAVAVCAFTAAGNDRFTAVGQWIKDTGLRNLPLKGFAQNQVWCEIVALACELLAWTQMLAPGRHRPPVGTQAAAAAPVLSRRPPGPWRPPPPAPPCRALAVGRRHHRRGRPAAGPPVRLTSRNHPYDHEGAATRARGTRPPGTTAGAIRHGTLLKVTASPPALRDARETPV